MSRVAVTGATGLIGRALVATLVARGDEVVALSRSGTNVGGATAVRWDPASEALPAAAREVDAVVNLAGEPIGPARWTADKRRRILESRLAVTTAVATSRANGATLVSASAVGFYGPTEIPVDESGPVGRDFLAEVCHHWEDAARRGEDRGRVVVARTGIVLSREGGALAVLRRLARLGALGPLGDGRQWVPWIHLADEVGALVHCLDHPELSGPVNLVAPHPVRQREFAQALAHSVHRPAVLRAPSFAVRAALGDASTMVLEGQQVVPAQLATTGFTFQFPELASALADLSE